MLVRLALQIIAMLLTATKRSVGVTEWRPDLQAWAPTSKSRNQAEVERLSQLPLPDSPPVGCQRTSTETGVLSSGLQGTATPTQDQLPPVPEVC